MNPATNIDTTAGPAPWVAIQLSYSTADIENAVFFGSTHQAQASPVPLGVVTLLAVNGEMFTLDEQTTPAEWPAFTEHAGLVQLATDVDAIQ